MRRRPGLMINGVEVPSGPRWRPPPPEPPKKRERIFDHLEGTGEDGFFSKVAHEMHREPWWSGVPVIVPPFDVAGEIGGAR